MTDTVTMYDATNPANIPASAEAVAGYNDGWYKWTTASWDRFGPNVHRKTIAVVTRDDADILDVERGDATPDDVPEWTTRQRDRGSVATVYANAEDWSAIETACLAAKIEPPFHWLADWDHDPALPAETVAKQWDSNASFDTSTARLDWLTNTTDPIDPPPVKPSPDPVPLPTPKVSELTMICTDLDTGKALGTDTSGNLYAEPGQLPAVVTLPEHPEWNAGGTEANGPCVGIVSELDANGSTHGYTFITQPANGKGSWGIYNKYHVNRDGSF